MTDWPNDTFLSARNIVRACEASLRRMQTDWIDLYQFHHVDLRDAVGGDLAGLRDARRAGQGALRRLVQPRRLADRRGQRGGRPPALPGPGQRAVALQPAHPARRARGAAGRAALRRRHHPVEPAGRRPARPGCWRRPRAAGATRSATRSGSSSTARRSRRTRRSAASSGRRPPTSGWPGCCTSRRVTAPIVGPRTMEQFEGVAAPRSRSSWTTPPWTGSTRSSRATRPAPMEYAW